eukprot:scaffold194689_cov43-Prasinocladus_malaysianus.AAC.1
MQVQMYQPLLAIAEIGTTPTNNFMQSNLPAVVLDAQLRKQVSYVSVFVLLKADVADRVVVVGLQCRVQ